MNTDIETLQDYKERIDDLKQKKANLEGQLETTMVSLKEGFGIDSIKKAKKAFEKLVKTGKEAAKQFEKLMKEIEELHEWEKD